MASLSSRVLILLGVIALHASLALAAYTHQHKHSARKKITCTESVSRIIRKERLFRILGAITSGAKSAQIARGFIFLITQYLPRQLFIFQKGNLISGPKC
jgi:ABC-type enterobactin transport system permease subunit